LMRWFLLSCNGKDTKMNTGMHAKEHLERMANKETIVAESNELVKSGFTPEEIVSLLWLQQWYQNGGSDRVTMVRHWEFLKLLVMHGRLEV
jgi:hypothetical protein